MEIHNQDQFSNITLNQLFDLINVLLSPRGSTRIEYTKVGNYNVSTVDTSDMGLETAIISDAGTYPVQRYTSLEEAKKGHLYWVDFLQQGNRTIKVLGYLILPETTVTL